MFLTGKSKQMNSGFLKKEKKSHSPWGSNVFLWLRPTIFKMAHIGLCDWIRALSWKRSRKTFLFPHF